MTNTVDQFLLLEQGQVMIYDGDLNDYRSRILPASSTTEKKKQTTKVRPGKEIRQLKTKLNTLESSMERLQRKLTETETKLSEPNLFSDPNNPDLQGLLRDQLEFSEALTHLENEWLELSHELEGLASD